MHHKAYYNHAIKTEINADKINGIDIINTEIFDVWCRLEQVKGVITVWRDAYISDKITCVLMDSIMTLLESVEEAVEKAETRLITYEQISNATRK